MHLMGDSVCASINANHGHMAGSMRTWQHNSGHASHGEMASARERISLWQPCSGTFASLSCAHPSTKGTAGSRLTHCHDHSAWHFHLCSSQLCELKPCTSHLESLELLSGFSSGHRPLSLTSAPGRFGLSWGFVQVPRAPFLPSGEVGIGPLGGLSARSFSVLTPWGFQVAPRRKTPGLKMALPF